MNALARPNHRPQHSYGIIIIHHRLAWWLVEFPEADGMPLRARNLSGRLTPPSIPTVPAGPASSPSCRPYRPRSPWRDISNDAVGDSGSDIIGWREAADWIRPL